MFFLRKTPARILLIIGALLGGLWLVSLDFSKKISTDVLDLIPSGERAPELAVIRTLANEKQARVALFALRVPGSDELRERATRAFAAALLSSNAFTEAEVTTDNESRNAIGKEVFARRLDLLLPGWVVKQKAAFAAGGQDAAVELRQQSAFTDWLAEKTAASLDTFMSKPEALAFAELIPSDPLLLIPGLVEKMQSFDTSSAAIPENTALIWSLTREKPLTEAGQKPVFDAVAKALDAARVIAPEATLGWTGISRFAAESRSRIEREMSWLNIVSLLAVLAVAALCLRNLFKSLHLAPVVLGSILGAWVAVTLCFDRVHVLVFVVGSLLAGVAIDYGFYLYLHPPKTPGEPYAAKVRRLMKPLLGSALTTVIGFSLLLFSDLPLIRQLGVFVSAGLLCALVTAILWFAQIKNPNMQARAFASAQVPSSPLTRRLALGLLSLGVLVALIGPWRLQWRDNIRALEVPTPQLTKEAVELRSLFGDTPTRTVYLTRGETIADARDSLEKFTAWRVSRSPNTAMASLGYVVPLRTDFDALPSDFEKLRDFPSALRVALERHGFNAGDFASFFDAWKNHTPAADYDATVDGFASSLRGQTALLLSTTRGASFIMTLIDEPSASAAEPPAELATIGLNQLESLNKLFARYRLSAFHLSAIGLVLVGLSMWFIYGVKRGTLIFTTPVGSCLFTFGVLGLCGVTLNLFHLLGAFLGVCLSHNYAIFTAENDARKEQPPPSIRLSALSTAASFGVLACSSIPVVSALGVTVTLIVITALMTVELKRVARATAGR